ncbi:MAG TPA: imidazole glycerol phosphate synthase subunit HisF [Gemmatimonadaceae bacterium]|nr:imidazole glycerol phosphate synthase subunit HisF [Gemmatimonadaceae bacterium]
MLTRRVIACLDVRGGRVVKGTRFDELRDIGDPAEMAASYEHEGADEIVFLDVSASVEQRATLLDVATRTAERVFIPLTVGGGVQTPEDVGRVLRAGADKVSLNTAAVARPEVLSEAAARFGAQCIVASIDAKRRPCAPDRTPGTWEVYVQGGRRATGRDVIAWACECVSRGAGEILLTSIDRDGTRSGYDLELTQAVARAVQVPVIASGGAGTPAHVREALGRAGADAALVAGIVHDREVTIRQIKSVLVEAGMPVRMAKFEHVLAESR